MSKVTLGSITLIDTEDMCNYAESDLEERLFMLERHSDAIENEKDKIRTYLSEKRLREFKERKK